MRITNSIITNNTKANINLNKIEEDRMNTMVASGQKITRPSDDPVVAIRALRLNSSMATLNQYYDKNIPDASAWLKTTETALTQTDEVITKIRENITTGSSDDNTAEDRMNILAELSSLRDQIYASGNSDYAGRTVFTGYRTGEMLTFMEPETAEYEIYEPIDVSSVEKFTYISGIQDVSKDILSGYNELDIDNKEYYRIKLAYDHTDSGQLALTYKKSPTSPVTTQTFTGESIKGKTQAEIDAIYDKATSGKPVYIIETGEIIISKDVYEELTKATDIEAKYTKSEWEKGDLRPEHYFMCKGPSQIEGVTGQVEYNFNKDNPPEGKTQGYKDQKITYEVAFNQSIEINTNAGAIYKHSLGRNIDDLIKITQDVVDADNKIETVKRMKSNPEYNTDASYKANVDTMLAAVTKERDLLKDTMQKSFAATGTKFADYQQELNDQISKVGSMRKRLEITLNRVTDQRENFKELSDENINIDLTESAIDLSNAKLALEAAQMAAGKISQQSLLNYI